MREKEAKGIARLIKLSKETLELAKKEERSSNDFSLKAIYDILRSISNKETHTEGVSTRFKELWLEAMQKNKITLESDKVIISGRK